MSTIKVDTLVAADGSSAVTLTKQQAAKSVVYFNGNGTLANQIYQTFNISSVSDDGTGEYSISFTNNHDDTYFAKVATGGRDSTTYQDRYLTNYDATTSSYEVQSQYQSGNYRADSQVSGVTFGDLA